MQVTRYATLPKGIHALTATARGMVNHNMTRAAQAAFLELMTAVGQLGLNRQVGSVMSIASCPMMHKALTTLTAATWRVWCSAIKWPLDRVNTPSHRWHSAAAWPGRPWSRGGMRCSPTSALTAICTTPGAPFTATGCRHQETACGTHPRWNCV